MTDWQHIHSESRNGFDINLYVRPEDLALEDVLDTGIDPETGKQWFDFDEMYEQIENGTLLHFVAKITASFGELELAEDYLGSCLYASHAEFYEAKNDLYDNMVDEVILEARKHLRDIQVRMIAVDLD